MSSSLSPSYFAGPGILPLGEEIIAVSPNAGNVLELALEEPILGFILTYS